MTQTCFFIIADRPEPTEVTTVETDSGPTDQISSGKKVYVMRKYSSRIITNLQIVPLLKKLSLWGKFNTLLIIQFFLLWFVLNVEWLQESHNYNIVMIHPTQCLDWWEVSLQPESHKACTILSFFFYLL